jgi:hypothetical protein
MLKIIFLILLRQYLSSQLARISKEFGSLGKEL